MRKKFSYFWKTQRKHFSAFSLLILNFFLLYTCFTTIFLLSSSVHYYEEITKIYQNEIFFCIFRVEFLYFFQEAHQLRFQIFNIFPPNNWLIFFIQWTKNSQRRWNCFLWAVKSFPLKRGIEEIELILITSVKNMTS